jgi:hypothetical protein
MSDDKKMTLAERRAEFERLLAQPMPDASPEEIARNMALRRRKNAEVFQLNPWRKQRWTAEPLKTSSYVAVEPTAADQIEELRRAVANAARQERLRADPLGIGLYGVESMADTVKRQDDTR